MMDPAEVPQGQGANPIPSSPRVDGRRLRRFVLKGAGSVSKVLDDDNLLIEILVRLPLKPSSLPRASAVCKRWGSILSDHVFHKRFRKHHRKPPLLGFFARRDSADSVFTPLLDRPDRIPAERFTVLQESDWDFMGCRHGLAVLISQSRQETIVWDPISGQQRHMPFPKGLNNNARLSYWHATVLCVDAEDGHVHGDCFLSPFKLVLICACCTRAFGVVYGSASGVWGNIISIVTTDPMSSRPGVHSDGVVSWVLQKTVQLEELFSSFPHMKTRLLMRGYDEDTNAIFLSSDSDDFMLQLETMQVTHIGIGNPWSLRIYYPYTNFYATVRAIAGRDGGAENVNT